MLLPELRARLARHPLLVASLRGGLALAAGACVWAVADDADQRRDSWGRTQDVLVAARTLRPGDAIGHGASRIERWPEALIPDGSLSTPPDGAQARQNVSAGEPITEDDVAVTHGPAGLLPAGRRGVVVPADADLRSSLTVGDIVGVVVEGRLVGDGPVVATGSSTVTVGLPSAAAAVVADAALLGTAAVVLGAG